MSNHYLFDYDDKKWDWATEAVTRFKEGFKRFNGYAEEKEQVYIGVYGPTQVGKTTFILSLMGIQLFHLNELADKLRGGQTKGNSATVTCTLFKKTDKEHFSIIWPSGEIFTCSTLEKIEEVMQKLRVTIYNQDDFPLAPVIIEIPLRFFNQTSINQRIRDLTIIDLPGDNSKNDLEMRHVNRVLKEYLSRCKVCIIMEIASQLTSLTTLDKDFVRDWMLLPDQFCILLTRSVTNDSVRKAIEAKEIDSAEAFQAMYAKELARVSEIDDIATPIYPLEFGDSWVDLQQSQHDLFEQTNPWVEALFDQLVEGLTHIHAPEQEIKKLKSMDRYILQKQKQELKDLQANKKNLDQELEEEKSLINQIRKRLMQDRHKVRLFLAFKYKLANYKLSKPEFNFPSWNSLDFAEKKWSYLIRQFYGELTDLEEKLHKAMNELNQVLLQFNKYHNKNLPLMIFPKSLFDTGIYLGRKMNRYFMETTYNEDVNRLEDHLSSVYTDYVLEYENAIQSTVQILDTYLKKQKLIRRVYIEEYLRERKIRSTLKGNIQFINGKIRQAYHEWELDLKRSQHLDQFLMASFIKHSSKYKEKLLDGSTSKKEKWIVHQYWNLLYIQARKVIDHVK